ncbi:MAG: polyphenol oxidase family protein, partial [Nocardioidaceae bacterium]
MLFYRDTRERVQVAFTDRHGGVSVGPYTSLNLGHRVGDDERAVARNIELAVGELSGAPPGVVRWAGMRQVHGAEVHLVDAGRQQSESVADALVTAEPGVVLLVRIADCVPVLLADQASNAVAVVHAGRSGLAAGVVPRAVKRLRALGAARSATTATQESAGSERLVAWIGPHVCGACY